LLRLVTSCILAYTLTTPLTWAETAIPAKKSQKNSGKSFEYTLLQELEKRLSVITPVKIIKNRPLTTAHDSFQSFEWSAQERYRITAEKALNLIFQLEPCLSNQISEEDILELEIASDSRGKQGDVRDLIIRRTTQDWEIGVSAKNNHRATKHSRLSAHIDFAEKWLGLNCSEQYFSEITPIFTELAKIQDQSEGKTTWRSLGERKFEIYTAILTAFKNELERLYNTHPVQTAQRLLEYNIGSKDFYKVIKEKGEVEIQAYNLRGRLNQPFANSEPSIQIAVLPLPDKIIDISFKKSSRSTIIISLNEGWKLSFRIHNASSRVEPSLKFDISLLQTPDELFKKTLLTL